MLDLTAAAEVDGVQVRRRRPVPLRSAHRHRRDRRRSQAAGRQHRRGAAWWSARSSRRSGRRPAAARRWASDEERKKFLTQVEKACRDRPDAARARHPPVRRRPHRLGGQPGDWAATRRATRRRSPRPSAQAARHRRDHGERLAAEGEICWGGMHCWRHIVELLERSGGPKTRRLPGRHGAHAALHARRQRARGSAAAGGLRLVGPGDARRRAQDNDRRAAALDDRFPRRPERRARSRARARTTRPAATACRSIPTASSTSSSTPASGCATTSGKLDAAVEHICWDGCMFPNAVMTKPQTWNDVLAS